METVNKKVIIIAVLLSLVTSALIYVYVTSATAKKELVETVNIYVAAKNLEPKQTITEADIKLVKIEKYRLKSNAITTKPDLIGKKLKESVLEGEAIVPERLLDNNTASMSYKIPEGMRAVSINVTELSAVSYLMRPGDKVDVVATFEAEAVEQETTNTVYPRITRTILQNVQVLAMGQDQEISAEKIAEGQATVTLAVNTADVEKLIYASEYSVLRLVLRPIEDTSVYSAVGAVRQDISSQKGIYSIPK